MNTSPTLPQPQEPESHLDAFQRLVKDPRNQLPNPDFDLYVLAIGFFLGRGVNLAQAYELANEVRFEHYYLEEP